MTMMAFVAEYLNLKRRRKIRGGLCVRRLSEGYYLWDDTAITHVNTLVSIPQSTTPSLIQFLVDHRLGLRQQTRNTT